MSAPANPLTDPTELGPPRKPGPGKAAVRSVEQRVAALPRLTPDDVMRIAHRVQGSANPLYAASNVSVHEILALTEILVGVENASRRKLLGESQ